MLTHPRHFLTTFTSHTSIHTLWWKDRPLPYSAMKLPQAEPPRYLPAYLVSATVDFGRTNQPADRKLLAARAHARISHAILICCALQYTIVRHGRSSTYHYARGFC